MSADMTGGGVTRCLRGTAGTGTSTSISRKTLVLFFAQGDSVYLQAGINTAEDLGPLEYAWSTGGDVQTELVNLDTPARRSYLDGDGRMRNGSRRGQWVGIEIPVYEPITGVRRRCLRGTSGPARSGRRNRQLHLLHLAIFEFRLRTRVHKIPVWVAVDQSLDSLVTFNGPFGDYQSTTEPGSHGGVGHRPVR